MYYTEPNKNLRLIAYTEQVSKNVITQGVYIYDSAKMTDKEAEAHLKSGEFSSYGFSLSRAHYDLIAGYIRTPENPFS